MKSGGMMNNFERDTLNKIRNRCIPLLMMAFIISYLDRVNVGFAAITANDDIGLTARMFGFGTGLTFFAYSIFELPSNLALERFGARKWLARIMITWGIIGCSMALVKTPLAFYIARFCLGAAEAGLFPGVILYLTYWFPARYRAKYVSMFALGIPLSIAIGAPISGFLLEMDGVMGMKGWQWLYILEALPAVILGLCVLTFLADKPEKANWLSKEQKDWLIGELEADKASSAHIKRNHALAMILDRRVLLLAGVFFLTGAPSYGLSVWLPQIVSSLGFGNIATGFISATPYIFGGIAMVLWGHHSDKRGERIWHTTISATVAFLGLCISAFAPYLPIQLLGLCMAASGIYGIKGPFLTFVSHSFESSNAAAGIALVAMLGNLSGFYASNLVPYILELTGSYRTALTVLGLHALAGGLLILASYKMGLLKRKSDSPVVQAA